MKQNSLIAFKINKRGTYILYEKYTLNLSGGTEGGRPLGKPNSARDAFRSIEQCVRARIWMSSTRPGSSYRVLVNTAMNLRGGADKSLARPTSRCRRTESILSLERGVCSCAELQVFSCYKG